MEFCLFVLAFIITMCTNVQIVCHAELVSASQEHGDPALCKDRLISFALAQQFALSNKFRVTVGLLINEQIWTASYGTWVKITFCMNETVGRKLSWAPPVLYTKEWVEHKT